MSADADPKTTASPAASEGSKPAPSFPAPQLRIHDRQVFVGFGPTPLGEGLLLADLALIAPDVTFPFDIAGSAATRYQKKKCRFGYVDVQVDHDLIHRALHRAQQACDEHVAKLQLHLASTTSLDGEGLVPAPEAPVPFTFRVGFHPEGSSVLAVIYDVRLYGHSPLPASWIGAILARAAVRTGAVPGSKPWGAIGLAFDPVADLLRKAVPLRGFRLPEMKDARLARVEPGPHAFHLHFAAGARAELALDGELLTCVEGGRSFLKGEALLEKGDLAAAEAFYLKHGEAPDSHPFAQERLLTLLAARPDAHDLALDLAKTLRKARPGAAASYWVEAQIRAQRGEKKKAGELLLELGRIARERGEEVGTFHALAAAGRAFAAESPAAASRAFQEALAVRPDDLGCLLALATAADRAEDHEGAMRAYRRICALARDPLQAARAHVRLGQLLGQLAADRAGARLHFDAALRLVPEDPEALLAMARTCRLDGEHLRAVRCLDQLRAAARAKEDPALEAVACFEAGVTWEEGLGHFSNALLRLQEACELQPRELEPRLRLAVVYEKLGRHAEAADSYQQVVVLAEGRTGGAEGEKNRAAAHRAHHALARIQLERLKDAGAARRHFEAALGLEPEDAVAMQALLPHWRQTGRRGEVARACERIAGLARTAAERAQLLAEAGEALVELGEAAKASRLLEQALLHDPACVRALAALAVVAESRADGPALSRLLLRLAEETREPAEKAAVLRRLARAARDLAGDWDLAADALLRLLAIEPDDRIALAELCSAQRRRNDATALAQALSKHAFALEREGEFAAAASALRELGELYAGRLGRTAEALELLERALALAPEDPQVLEALGELALTLGKAPAAREAFRSLVAVLPASAGPARLARIKAQLGRACDGCADRAGAADAYGAAFAQLPLEDAIADRLDVLLGELGRERDRAALRAARARAKGEAGLAGEAARHWAAAAQLLQRLGDPRAALEAFEAALAADPDGSAAPAALDALAEAALAGKKSERAAELIARRAAFEPEPRAAARLLMRSAQLLEGGDAGRVQQLLVSALSRDATYRPARAALARLRAAEGDWAQALANAEVALSSGADADPISEAERLELTRLAARAAREVGDLPSARRLLAAWSEARPDDTEALLELAELHRRAGAREDLVFCLERAVVRLDGPAALAPLCELGALLKVSPGRRDDGLAALRRALQLVPDHLPALQALAAALDRPADAPERARVLGRLIDLADDPADVSRLLVDSGEALLASGSFAEAAAAFAKASRVGERPAVALDRMAFAAREAKDADLELEALTRRAQLAAREREPQAAERHLELGLRLLELGRTKLADGPLARALELDPPEAVQKDALVALVDLLEDAGYRTAAAARLAQLAELLKGSERCAALWRRAEHLRATGDQAAARASLELATKAAPADRRAIAALKDLCAELGDERGYAAALEALLALPSRDRHEGGALAAELGLLYRKLGETAQAEDALRKALSLDRTLAGAARALLEVLLERGALDEAIPLGERLAPTLPRAEAAALLRDLAARALHGLADRELALRLARLAAQLDPDDLDGLRLRADLLYRMGAGAEALDSLQKLGARLDPRQEPDAALEARLRAGEVALALGDAAAAVPALRAALELSPTCATAADLLYEAQVASDPAAALAALEQHARALVPGARSHELFLRLARDARARLNDPARQAQLLALARPTAPDALTIDLARVEALRACGDQRALAETLAAVAERALQGGASEQGREALDELAAIQQSLGDAAAAAGTLAQSAQLWAAVPAEAARRHRQRGALLTSDAGSAEEAFRRALALDPSDLESAERVAELARTRGDAAAEAEHLEICARLLPAGGRRAEILVRLARLRAAAGDHDRAGGALGEALRLDPRLDEARDLLDAQLRAQGRLAELAQSLEARAEHADEARRRELLIEAGELYWEQVDDAAAAARAWRAALALSPDDRALSGRCAEALHAAGDLPGAAELDRALLAQDPLEEAAFARQVAFLKDRRDDEQLASLFEARAARLEGRRAADLWMDAAALRAAHGENAQAALDERRAFELDAAHPRAFAALLARARPDAPAELAALYLRRAQTVPAEALELHRSRARVLAEAGRAQEAAAAFDDALALAPEDLELLSARAELADAIGGDEAAAAFDARLLAAAGEGGLPADRLARSHLRLGFALPDAAEAAQHLEAALRLDPGSKRADRALARLADHFERTGQRQALHTTCLARARQLPAGPEQTRELRRALDAAPDAAAELGVLEQLAAVEPEDFPLRAHLAARLADCQRFEEAVAAYERAAALCQEGPRRARLLLAAAALLDDELDEAQRARELRREAREAAPEDPEVARTCLADLREAGDLAVLAGALELIGSNAADAEEAAWVRLERARVLERAGDGAAADVWLEIVRAGPKSAGFAEAAEKGRALLERERRFRDAAEVLAAQSAAVEDSELAARHLTAAARLLGSEENDPDGAMLLLTRAIDLKPRSPEPYAARAALHLARGAKAEQAADLLAEAARTSEPRAKARRLLDAAGLFDGLGRFEERLAALREAVGACPEELEARLALGAAAEQAGALAEAFEHVEAALALTPKTDPARPALERRAAQLAERAGLPTRAEELFEAVLAREPGDDEAFAVVRRGLEHRRGFEPLLAATTARERALSERGAPAAERAELHAERARLAAELGRPALAEACWRDVLTLVPDHRPALAALRSLATARGDAGAACDALAAEAALAADPAERLRLWRELAEARGRRGESALAAEAWHHARAAARDAGEEREALVELDRAAAPALLAAGRAREALEALEPLLASAAEPALRELAADACLALGEVQRARGHLLAAIEADPSRAESLARLEELEQGEAPAELAAALTARCRGLPPGAERARMLLRAASAWRAAGRADEERAALEQAFGDDPTLSPAFERLSAILEEAIDHPALAEALERRAGVETLDAPDRARLLARAAELWRGRDPARARASFERALAADGNVAGAAEALAELLAGDGPAAIASCAKLPDEAAARVALQVASSLESAGRAAQAADCYAEAARRQPGSLPANEGLLRTAEAAGEPARALQACLALLENADPNRTLVAEAELRWRTSQLLEALGRGAESIPHLEIAVLRKVGGAEALRRLSQHYLERQSWTDAASTLTWYADQCNDPAERVTARRTAADLYAGPLGDPAAGASILEHSFGETPTAEDLDRLAKLCARTGDARPLARAAAKVESAGADALRPFLPALADALAAAGSLRESLRRFQQVLEAEFTEAVAAQAGAIAERLQDYEALASIELQLARSLPDGGGPDVAARLREISEHLEQTSPERSFALLGEAHRLDPRDSDYQRQAALLPRVPGAGARAVGALALLARQEPLDREARQSVRNACLEAGDAERARMLATVDSYYTGLARGPAVPAARIGEPLRERFFEPAAMSPGARLLRAAGPVVGELFAADLSHWGVGPFDRIGPFHAPALYARVAAAQRATGAQVEPYLSASLGMEIALVPGSPDRLIIGAGALAGIEPRALGFLLLRACELSRAGLALPMLFGAAGLSALMRALVSACGLETEMPDSFAPHAERLAHAIQSQPSPELGLLARAARDELAGLDAEELLAAVERSASRAALIACGDAGAAMRAALRLAPEYASADLDAVDLEEAARRLPSVQEHVLTCLRDDLSALRSACTPEERSP